MSAQAVVTLVTKPDDLRPNSRAHMIEKKLTSENLSSDLHTCILTYKHYTGTHSKQTNKQIKIDALKISSENK